MNSAEIILAILTAWLIALSGWLVGYTQGIKQGWREWEYGKRLHESKEVSPDGREIKGNIEITLVLRYFEKLDERDLERFRKYYAKPITACRKNIGFVKDIIVDHRDKSISATLSIGKTFEKLYTEQGPETPRIEFITITGGDY